jgi:hypothetical protein
MSLVPRRGATDPDTLVRNIAEVIEDLFTDTTIRNRERRVDLIVVQLKHLLDLDWRQRQ